MGQPIRIDAPTQGQVLQPDLPPSKRYFEKWSNLTPEQQKKSGSKAEHRKKRIEEGLRLPHQEARDKSKTVLENAASGSDVLSIGEPSSNYGAWKDLPEGVSVTADWKDKDEDGIDDRRQDGPGMPSYNSPGESNSNDMFANSRDVPFQGPYNQEATRSGKGYFSEFDPGKRIGKSEMKGAVDAGVSYHKINKYIKNTGAEPTQIGSKFLERKLGEVSTKIKHYDPTTAGGGGFTKKDVKYLMSEEGGGHSAKKVEKLRDKYVNEGQIRVGENTQKHIDRIGGNGNNPPIENQPVDEASKPKDKPNKKTPKLSKAQQISNDMRVRSNLSNQMMFGDSPIFF